ncbi:hypothetical protein [Nostoc sp.]
MTTAGRRLRTRTPQAIAPKEFLEENCLWCVVYIRWHRLIKWEP